MRDYLLRHGLRGILVTDLLNVRYLSGFTGSSGFVLLTKSRNIFVTDFRYREQAEKELHGGMGTQHSGREGRGSFLWDLEIEKGKRVETIRRLTRRHGIRTLGFESTVTYGFFKALSRTDLRLRQVKGVVERLRETKDGEELARIREAVKRAEAAFLQLRPYIRIGRREREIALRLEGLLKRQGCDRIPFDIIVASGPNGALPHARTSDRKLSPGDLVVIDWGGEAEGYFSDMTRTLLLRDHDLSKKREVYNHVLEANRRAIQSVAPGMSSREIDNRARDSIKNAGYGECFGHGTGHGVGLNVHEAPSISPAKREIVRENMVFTVEPGIYIPGFGGVRIEDMVLVKQGGPEILTSLPKSLDII